VKKPIVWASLGLFSLLLSLSAHAQSYSIDWSKVASGGGTSTGGVYSLSRNDAVAIGATVGKGLWAYDKPHQAIRRIGSPNSDRIH
jgi:hypothetical protein